MLDLLFWAFFGLGFLIVTIFRSVWESRKDRDIWKGSGNSLLQR